jgi:hypothetical protein
MAELRNGQHVEDPRLDRIFQLDWRSLNFTVGRALIRQGTSTHQPRSYTWNVDTWLDQGSEGACVGFSFGHELAAKPQVVSGLTNRYARESIYWEAQKIDQWDGGAYPGGTPFYEGTSVLAGAQINKRNGFYESYSWALSIEELARGLAYFGPCVLGIDWFEGMYDTDAKGYIHPYGNIVGGHAILAHSIKIVYKTLWSWTARTWADVDWDRSYVVLWNSWSERWGVNGTAKISLRDLEHLLLSNGDACFPKRTSKVSLV